MKCSRAIGESFLEGSPETTDAKGRSIIWKSGLIEKYREGKNRPEGTDPKRLRLVSVAVLTTRYPGRIVESYRGNQRFYYRAFQQEAMVVFVDNETTQVNGFMRGTIDEVRRSIGRKYF
ncbi:MAG: hypothetical protein ACI4RT_06630 [Candidatus Spyradenecus sp.]